MLLGGSALCALQQTHPKNVPSKRRSLCTAGVLFFYFHINFCCSHTPCTKLSLQTKMIYYNNVHWGSSIFFSFFCSTMKCTIFFCWAFRLKHIIGRVMIRSWAQHTFFSGAVLWQLKIYSSTHTHVLSIIYLWLPLAIEYIYVVFFLSVFVISHMNILFLVCQHIIKAKENEVKFWISTETFDCFKATFFAPMCELVKLRRNKKNRNKSKIHWHHQRKWNAISFSSLRSNNYYYKFKQMRNAFNVFLRVFLRLECGLWISIANNTFAHKHQKKTLIIIFFSVIRFTSNNTIRTIPF